MGLYSPKDLLIYRLGNWDPDRWNYWSKTMQLITGPTSNASENDSIFYLWNYCTPNKKRRLWKGTPDTPQLLLATGKTVVKGCSVSASEQARGFLAVPLGFSFPIMSLIHSDWGSRAWRRYGHLLLPLWGMVVQPPRTMLLYCYVSGCTWSNLLSQNRFLAFIYIEPIVFAKHIFIYNLIWASKHPWCK